MSPWKVLVAMIVIMMGLCAVLAVAFPLSATSIMAAGAGASIGWVLASLILLGLNRGSW